MDDSLRIIQYLYGEEIDDPDFARRVADDEDLRREFDRLQETKDVLDRRSAPSPDPDVVDRVVDRAAEAAHEKDASGPAPDRAARAPDRSWTRRLQNAGAALALLAALGIGWWYMPGDGPTAETATGEAAAQRTAPASASSGQAQDGDALPAWDDSDEVVRLHRRLELLQTQSRSDAWGGDVQPASRDRP
jgi:negative regulator of sigma E activity